MAYHKLLCLANSRWNRRRCIAGIDLSDGTWVRPVNSNGNDALTDKQCTLDNGMQPSPFDIIEVDLIKHTPKLHQPENWTIGPKCWRMVEHAKVSDTYAELVYRLNQGPDIFGDERDCIPVNELCEIVPFAPELPLPKLTESLTLVAPRLVEWQIIFDKKHDNRQTRAVFYIKRTPYNLVVTDPVWEWRLAHLPVCRQYDWRDLNLTITDRFLLTISLADPIHASEEYGACYKIVAGVMLISEEDWLNIRNVGS